MLTQEAPRNPYPEYDAAGRRKGWRWLDETGAPSEKLYASQLDALDDLKGYIHFLNYGPTLWQRCWWPIRYKLWPLLVKFWKS